MWEKKIYIPDCVKQRAAEGGRSKYFELEVVAIVLLSSRSSKRGKARAKGFFQEIATILRNKSQCLTLVQVEAVEKYIFYKK